MSTLGGQQQTIGQNAQNFPLTNLASLGSLLQGYSIPVGTKTTLCMSPLSSLAAAGAGAMGLYQKIPGFKSLVDSGLTSVKDFFGSSSGTGHDCDFCCNSCDSETPCWAGNCCSCSCGGYFAASGGLIKSKARGYTGCASTTHRGALPQKKG
jgi:hypothetical protein